MSDVEFNTQVAEVLGMVSMAHGKRNRQWGILVPGEQVQHLLQLEADNQKLQMELERGKRELERVERRAREVQGVQDRAEKLPRIVGTALRISFPFVYLLGASVGLMDPLFAWAMGLPCIAWAVGYWKGVWRWE